jgi:hypothetical protein
MSKTTRFENSMRWKIHRLCDHDGYFSIIVADDDISKRLVVR